MWRRHRFIALFALPAMAALVLSVSRESPALATQTEPPGATSPVTVSAAPVGGDAASAQPVPLWTVWHFDFNAYSDVAITKDGIEKAIDHEVARVVRTLPMPPTDPRFAAELEKGLTADKSTNNESIGFSVITSAKHQKMLRTLMEGRRRKGHLGEDVRVAIREYGSKKSLYIVDCYGYLYSDGTVYRLDNSAFQKLKEVDWNSLAVQLSPGEGE